MGIVGRAPEHCCVGIPTRQRHYHTAARKKIEKNSKKNVLDRLLITHLLVQILVYISGNSLVGSNFAPLRAPMARVGWYGIPPAPGLWVVERLAERVGEGLELALRGKRLASVTSSFLYFSASASMRSISSFETALTVGDREAVRLFSGLVGTRDVEDTIGVDVEGDLDLRNATGCRMDTGELEFAEVIVHGAGTLTFEDLGQHTGLVEGVVREDFGLLGRDGVALDERGRDAPAVSILSERGVTSRRTWVFLEVFPMRMAA